MLVECVAHFESHRSQFSPNLLDLLCLQVAQVPRSQNNILAIIMFTMMTTITTMTYNQLLISCAYTWGNSATLITQVCN